MDDESGGRSPEREGDGAAPDLADQHPLPVNDSAVSNVSNARELLPALAAQEETVGTTDLPLDPPTEASDTAQEQEQQPTQPQVDESEVFFLIADFLKRRSTCQKAADTLIEELAEHQLLKCAVDWKGERKIATYEDYRLRHRDLAPGHLMELLKGAAATFPKSVTSCKDVKKSKEAKEEKRSLLMKSRVAKKLQLSEDERRKLAQQIVKELFAVRGVMKTLRVVEKVIKKYERYQQYTKVSRMEDLPIELQQMLMGTDDAGARTETSAEKVVTLAADVRALKQLFQLRQERAELEKKIEEMMNRAKKSELFQTTVRTGRNQMSLLRRREVSSYRDPRLPPSFVYSRIRRLKTLSGHLQIQAYCLAYDKLGKVVITGSDDRLVKIWSLATGDLLFTLRGHVGNITDLAVNCANTLLASSSDDKTVRIWELSTGAPVAVLVGHSSVVNSVRFHPKRNIVVTASDDGHCFCYKLPDVPLVDKPETKIETARRLFSLNAYMLSLHPICSMSHTRREGVRSCKVHCIAYSRCGDFVVSGSHDGIARVWDLSAMCDPDAPAVVPRFQPTDEPQALRAQDQPNVNGIGSILPPSTTPFAPSVTPVPSLVPAPTPQPFVPPSTTAQMLSELQLPRGQLDVGTVPAPMAPFSAVGTPAQPLRGDERVLVQPQGNPPVLLPVAPETVAEADPRRPQLPQPPQVQQNDLPAVTLSDIDVPSIEPIALLKGHKGPVTTVVYNNKGDQIATASIKDSTTRIWRWKKKYKSLHASVLVVQEAIDHDDISAIYGVRGRKKAFPVVDTLAWTHDDTRLVTLHSVKLNSQAADSIWEQRIRVWDPTTGRLMMTLGAVDQEKKNGHINAVFALDTHPMDWRIVVTAGYDGRVFLWDISTGRMLKSFINLSPDSKPLSNLDGGFTPDGNGFCFTDQVGRLLIFGTGSGEQYSMTPVQQYFLHDYVMLVTDAHYNVLDRETQELPSLMPSGPLMDASLVQYPHQPPHLMSSQVPLTPEQYAENRRLRIQQCIESEIQCAVRHLPGDEDSILSFPLAIVKSDRGRLGQQQRNVNATDALAIARASYRLNGAPVMLSELRRRGFGSRSHVRRRRPATPAEERDTSVLEIDISSEDDRGDEDFQVPTPRHAAEEEEEDEDDEEADEDDFDLDEDDFLSDNDDAMISPANARRRRLRSNRQRESPRARFPTRGGRRLQPQSEHAREVEETPRQLRARRSAARARSRQVLDSDAEDDGDLPEEHTGEAVGAISEPNDTDVDAQSTVVVESNDGFIMGDNQIDRFDETMTYAEMLEAKRSQLATTQDTMPLESTEEALIPCAFCGVGDDGAMLKLPGDGMSVHPLIYGSQRVFVHEQCTIASPLCFNRNGNWYNVTREIRRGRSLSCVGCSKRGATVGCTVTTCRNSYHWKCAINFGWSVDQMHFFCPDHQSLRERRHRQRDNNQGTTEDGGAVIEPAAKRFGLVFHREWLQLVSLRSIHQYVPQVGDYVVYLPEGHPGYLRFGNMPNPRYYDRLSKFYALKCRVLDVKYVFPTADEHVRCSTIKCEISLAVLAVPTSAVRLVEDREEHKHEDEEMKDGGSSDATELFNPESSPFAEFTSVDDRLLPAANEPSERFGFKVLYHSNDVANFLVLDHIYENGICGNWHVGDRVQMPFVGLNEHGLEIEAKMSYGKIKSIVRKPLASDRSAEAITPWECVTVDWDSPEDDACAVCPWELEPESPEELSEKRILSLRRGATRMFFSRSIIGEKRDALLEEMNRTLALPPARDFMYPVDEETFLDYLITVANPIDLTKIQQRLRHGYYRQVEAFLADAKLISINCETYNVQTSGIAQSSRNLYNHMLTQTQRIFPHLLREANNGNSHAANGRGRYTYPPDDFVSNFSVEPVETHLELLEITLLSPTPEGSETTGSTNGAVSTERSTVATSVNTDDIPAVTPSRTTRSLQSEECKESDEEAQMEAIKELIETIDDPDGDLLPTSTLVTTDAAVVVVESDTSSQTPNQQTGSPFRSPRVRRIPRVVATPSRNGDGPTRKRQRTNPDQVLISYSDLLAKLSVAQRDAVKSACEEDLRAVLQDFHEALVQADKGDVFAAPVTDDVAPDYSSVISHPQDFGTMMDRLLKYKSFREYFADVELVFSNAIKYNGWNCYIGGLVEDLQKYCFKFLLDAAGVDHQALKAVSTRARAARSTNRPSPSKSKRLLAPTSKQNTRRKPAAAVLDDDDEDSWNSSSTSESEEDEDEDNEDDLSSAESDWDAPGRKRQLRRPARAANTRKKVKRRN